MKKTSRKIAVLLALSLAMSLTACGGTAASSAVAAPNAAAQSDVTTSEPQSTTAKAASEATAEPASQLAPTPTSEPAPESASQPAESKPNADGGSKILIAYFSRVENITFDSNVDAVASASININGEAVTGNVQVLAGMIETATGGDVFSIQTEEKYPSSYRSTTDLAKTEQSKAARPALATHVENFDSYDVVFLGYPNWWGTLPMAAETFLEEYDFSGKTIIPFASHEGSGLGSGPRDIAALCPGATVLEGIAVRGGSVSGAQSNVESWINGLDLGALQAAN